MTSRSVDDKIDSEQAFSSVSCTWRIRRVVLGLQGWFTGWTLNPKDRANTCRKAEA